MSATHIRLVHDREGRAREVVARIQLDTSAVLEGLARRRRRNRILRDVGIAAGAVAVPLASGALWGRTAFYGAALAVSGGLLIVAAMLSLEQRLP